MTDENTLTTDVGDLRLGSSIGKGAYGDVYNALLVNKGNMFAVKQLDLTLLPTSLANSITTEVDLLKRLDHRHIVRYITFFRTKKHLNIVMELIEGGSLFSLLKKFGTFPEPLVVVYLKQILIGLDYLHSQGVIHRDIKASNMLVTKDGDIKIADFGVACTDVMTSTEVIGTPYWMAPEIIELSGPTTKSDIWSLGCTVIELLIGNPPFYNFPPLSALYHIVKDDTIELPENISVYCRNFLECVLRKDPTLRPSAHSLTTHRWLRNVKSESLPVEKVAEVQKKRSNERKPQNPKKTEQKRNHSNDKRLTMMFSTSLQTRNEDEENWEQDFDITNSSVLEIRPNISHSRESSSTSMNHNRIRAKTGVNTERTLHTKSRSKESLQSNDSGSQHTHCKNSKSESLQKDSSFSAAHLSKVASTEPRMTKSLKMSPNLERKSKLDSDSNGKSSPNLIKSPEPSRLKKSDSISSVASSDSMRPKKKQITDLKFTIISANGTEVKTLKRDLDSEWDKPYEDENEIDVFDVVDEENPFKDDIESQEHLHRKELINNINSEIEKCLNEFQHPISVKPEPNTINESVAKTNCETIVNQLALLETSEKVSILHLIGVNKFRIMLSCCNFYFVGSNNKQNAIECLISAVLVLNSFIESCDEVAINLCSFGILTQLISIANSVINEINTDIQKNSSFSSSLIAYSKKRIQLLDAISQFVSEMVFREKTSKMFIACNGIRFFSAILNTDFDPVTQDLDTTFRKQTLIERTIGDVSDVIKQYKSFSASKHDLGSLLVSSHMFSSIQKQLLKFSNPTTSTHPHIQNNAKSHNSKKLSNEVHQCDFCETLVSALLSVLLFLTNGDNISQKALCDQKTLKSFFELFGNVSISTRFFLFKFINILSANPFNQDLLFNNGVVQFLLPFLSLRSEGKQNENRELFHILSAISNICSFAHTRCKVLTANDCIQNFIYFSQTPSSYRFISFEILCNIVRANPSKDKPLRLNINLNVLDLFLDLLPDSIYGSHSLPMIALWATSDKRVLEVITTSKLETMSLVLVTADPRSIISVVQSFDKIVNVSKKFSYSLAPLVLSLLSNRLKRKALGNDGKKVVFDLFIKLLTDLAAHYEKKRGLSECASYYEIEQNFRILKNLESVNEKRMKNANVFYSSSLSPLIEKLNQFVNQAKNLQKTSVKKSK